MFIYNLAPWFCGANRVLPLGATKWRQKFFNYLFFCSIWSMIVCLFWNLCLQMEQKIKKTSKFCHHFCHHIVRQKGDKKLWWQNLDICLYKKFFLSPKWSLTTCAGGKWWQNVGHFPLSCLPCFVTITPVFCHHCRRYMGLGETPQNREDRILNAVFCLWCTPT